MHPRFLITLDENLQPLPVNVRVGQAVDVVGQAGRPKTITGWQTQNTPVLLAYGERAELEDDEYISLSNTLEGLVILKKVSPCSQNSIWWKNILTIARILTGEEEIKGRVVRLVRFFQVRHISSEKRQWFFGR